LKEEISALLLHQSTEALRALKQAHASVLADLAMRGLAISFSTRASVALSDSFVGFLTVPMSTF